MNNEKENNSKAAIIVHSGYFDRIMSAYIIGNGYLSMGVPVTLFFTFWGLNSLRKGKLSSGKLSMMNLLGLGKLFILRKIKKSKVADMERLASSYKKLGGEIVACTMTMELMGIEEKDLRKDLVDNFATVGTYCYTGKDSNITLFI